jgi:hypothetical protein
MITPMRVGEEPGEPRGRAFTRRHLVVTAVGVLCLIAQAVLAGFQGGDFVVVTEFVLRALGVGLIGAVAGSAAGRWRAARRRK